MELRNFLQQLKAESNQSLIDAGVVTPFVKPNPLLQSPNLSQKLLDNVLSTVGELQPNQGALSLRSLVRQDVTPLLTAHPENLIITYGATHALLLSMTYARQKVKAGGIVSTFVPFFPPYKIQSDLLGFNFVPLTLSHQFQIDEQCMTRLVDVAPDVLILCDPCNPTGIKLSVAEMDLLVRTLEKLPNTIVILDSTYWQHSTSSTPHLPKVATDQLTERLFIITSYSKSGVTHPNMRAGCLICPSSQIADSISKMMLATTGTISTLVTTALEYVLNGGNTDEEREQYATWAKLTEKKRNGRIRLLQKSYPHLDIIPNAIGCFGLFHMNLSSASTAHTDERICIELARKYSVVISPGCIFGFDNSQLYFRVSFGIPKKQIERIFEVCEEFAANN